MRLTIIPSDTFCAVDGVGYNGVDMSSLVEGIHAIQWNGTTGWVEYADRSDGSKPANQEIDNIEQFSLVIEAWNQIDYAHKNPPKPDPVPPTAEQNKATAEGKLSTSDWSQLPDVNLANKDEFAAYRATLRNIAINPVAGFLAWPVEPNAVWITVTA